MLWHFYPRKARSCLPFQRNIHTNASLLTGTNLTVRDINNVVPPRWYRTLQRGSFLLNRKLYDGKERNLCLSVLSCLFIYFFCVYTNTNNSNLIYNSKILQSYTPLFLITDWVWAGFADFFFFFFFYPLFVFLYDGEKRIMITIYKYKIM